MTRPGGETLATLLLAHLSLRTSGRPCTPETLCYRVLRSPATCFKLRIAAVSNSSDQDVVTSDKSQSQKSFKFLRRQ